MEFVSVPQDLSEYKGNRMNAMKALACLMPVLFAAGGPYADEGDPKITDRKVSVVGFVDAGQVIKGSLIIDDGASAPLKLDNAFLNRNGIALTYSGTLNGNVHMNIGVGGLFWKPLPETPNVGSKRIQFGPGISEASAQYDFSSALSLKFGFFGYKYNPEAVNLGEYLLRSEAYPTLIRTGSTGGWVWMNSNEYKSMGAKLSWDMLGGALRHDVLLFSEFNEAPIFDFSPSYVATAKLGNAFEFGAGFSLHRWLPIKPSQTTPKSTFNTYVEVDGFPAFPALNDTVNNRHQLGFSGGTLKDIENQVGSYLDSAGSPIATVGKDSLGNTVFILADGRVLRPKVSKALTFKGVKVMARAALNIGNLLGMEEERTGSFKLFGEVGILGVQNQPYYYEKIEQRIPLMVGMNLPTFGILNLFALQLEYFKNPYPENSYEQFNNTLPRPAYPSGNPAIYEANRLAGMYSEDDLKWTLYVQKKLFPGLDLFVQAANDHFRVQDVTAQPSFGTVTRERSDWYYMIRFQWGM
jgi:hypothetical protein